MNIITTIVFAYAFLINVIIVLANQFLGIFHKKIWVFKKYKIIVCLIFLLSIVFLLATFSLRDITFGFLYSLPFVLPYIIFLYFGYNIFFYFILNQKQNSFFSIRQFKRIFWHLFWTLYSLTGFFSIFIGSVTYGLPLHPNGVSALIILMTLLPFFVYLLVVLMRKSEDNEFLKKLTPITKRYFHYAVSTIVISIFFSPILMALIFIKPSEYAVQMHNATPLAKQIAKGYKYQVDNNASLPIQIEAFRDDVEKNQQQAENLGIHFKRITFPSMYKMNKVDISYNGYSYEFIGGILMSETKGNGIPGELAVSVYEAPGMKENSSLDIFINDEDNYYSAGKNNFILDGTKQFDVENNTLTKEEADRYLNQSVNNFKDMMDHYLQYINSN